MTEHAYTNWKLVRDDGTLVYEKTAHFLANPENLYEVEIPANLLEDEVSYTINCQYKGKNYRRNIIHKNYGLIVHSSSCLIVT